MEPHDSDTPFSNKSDLLSQGLDLSKLPSRERHGISVKISWRLTLGPQHKASQCCN